MKFIDIKKVSFQFNSNIAIIGKFAPFTIAHKQLIENAINSEFIQTQLINSESINLKVVIGSSNLSRFKTYDDTKPFFLNFGDRYDIVYKNIIELADKYNINIAFDHIHDQESDFNWTKSFVNKIGKGAVLITSNNSIIECIENNLPNHVSYLVSNENQFSSGIHATDIRNWIIEGKYNKVKQYLTKVTYCKLKELNHFNL
jgi:nicotinamide mononucleotide adenylyltransferase